MIAYTQTGSISLGAGCFPVTGGMSSICGISSAQKLFVGDQYVTNVYCCEVTLIVFYTKAGWNSICVGYANLYMQIALHIVYVYYTSLQFEISRFTIPLFCSWLMLG